VAVIDCKRKLNKSVFTLDFHLEAIKGFGVNLGDLTLGNVLFWFKIIKANQKQSEKNRLLSKLKTICIKSHKNLKSQPIE
jgi:hypothetical protein